MNLMMLLEMAAGGFGDRVAVGSRNGGLTFQQLFDRAGACLLYTSPSPRDA